MNFLKNLSSGSRDVPYRPTIRRTHKHDKDNNLLRKYTNAPKYSHKIKHICLTPLFILQVFLFLINYHFNACEITNNFLQNWGDYTDMSQAVLVYVTYAGDVLLICWFGDQLTQHVRKNGLLLLLLNLLIHYVHNVYGVLN